MPCPFHPPNYTCWRVKLWSLLSLHLSSDQIFSQHPVLKHPQSISSLNVREQVSHPYRTTDKIIVLHILIFMFFDSRREDKSFWTKW
jgi:hypothetical protein